MKSLKYQLPSQPIEYNFDPSRIKEIPEWEWDKWARHGAVDWTPYSSISDYRAKEITGTEGWSESLQHYTPTQYIRTGNPTSGFKYYSVPQFTPKGYTYSPSTTLSTQTAVSTSTPTTTTPNSSSRPVQQTAISQQGGLPRQPKRSIPAHLLPYLASVNNGSPQFTLPQGYTNEQFLLALRTTYQSNPSLSSLKPAQYLDPRPKLSASTPSTDRVTIPPGTYSSTSNPTGTNKTVETDNQKRIYLLYATPSETVNVYNIHPDAYSKVLEELQKLKPQGGSSEKTYKLSVNPYKQDMANDSIFNYIGSNGEVIGVVPVSANNNRFVSNGDEMFISNVTGNLTPGKVSVEVTKTNDSRLLPSTSRGRVLFPLSPLYENQLINTWATPNLRYLKTPQVPYQSPQYAEDWSTTTYEQRKLAANELLTPQLVADFETRSLASFKLKPQGDSMTLSELLNQLPSTTPQQLAPTLSKTIGETIIDTGKQAVETVKQAGESIASTGKKAVKKVLGWFGFKQGGTITYFDYFY